MSAAEALKQARAAAVQVDVDGDDLVLSASAPPAQRVLSALADHKAGVLALLRYVACDWTAEDWLAFFNERAGVAQFLTRHEAELRAFACCVTEWTETWLVPSPPGRCLDCGRGDERHNPLLPFGNEAEGQIWLHSRCWRAWYTARRTAAVMALAMMGIKGPVEHE